MALRGVKPTAVQKRLKALFYGPAGVGKTTAAIQFPRPYLIDTERGAENDEYVEHLNRNGGAVFQTNIFDDMVREVTALLTEKHEFRTLIIDPVTTVYNDLVDKAEQKVGNEFGRHFGEAKKHWKRLGNLLMRLDMNVILTSHEKNLYGGAMAVIGKTYDGPKGLDYLFDLVFEIEKRGKERFGRVRKTRIKSFPEDEQFPFTYDAIADKYGREVLEREAEVEQLASADQVAELKRLIELLKVPQEETDKWLDKAQAMSFDEMPAEAVAKCVKYLNGKITGTAA